MALLLASRYTRVMVRKIAIGSLVPDSISRVAPVRSFSSSPARRNRPNTAAASVEPTIAPISMASSQDRSRIQYAAAPVMAAVISTPTVARESAGLRLTRNVLLRVPSPPSNRIIASARLPNMKARLKSLKRIPPGPSSPASMPSTRNTSRMGAPSRRDSTLASTHSSARMAPPKINWLVYSSAMRNP